MAYIINRREGIMSEQRSLKSSPIKQQEDLARKKAIMMAILFYQNKIANYQIYENLYNREFMRLLNGLKKTTFSDENINLIIEGYISYLIENRDKFDYLELRKYRKGVLNTIRKCALEYGMSFDEIQKFMNGEEESIVEPELEDNFEVEDDFGYSLS